MSSTIDLSIFDSSFEAKELEWNLHRTAEILAKYFNHCRIVGKKPLFTTLGDEPWKNWSYERYYSQRTFGFIETYGVSDLEYLVLSQSHNSKDITIGLSCLDFKPSGNEVCI